MTGHSDSSLVLHEQTFAEDAHRILAFLEHQGTFRFPTLSTGLFSAAAGEGGDFELTGYRSVWVRDNIHIANAHAVWGETAKTEAALQSLMAYFTKYRQRFVDAIEGRSNPQDPMQRPHIRFDGNRLLEVNEKWSHAQNDALGAFLWLYCRTRTSPTPDEWAVLVDLVLFLKTIEYWKDEDSGHWEEVRKVAASSVGVAVAGLKAFRALMSTSPRVPGPSDFSDLKAGRPITTEIVNEMIQRGEETLIETLPAECIQPDPNKRRLYDSALLFLIYPYQIVDRDTAQQIVSNVTTFLMGDHGIRRYIGDSYWCADYKQKLAANERTVDFSDNLADRDSLLKPGMEAQWCLFDPIVSIHYGLRYQQTNDAEDRRRQIHHLQRSLNQLTKPGSRFGAYRCPESNYCERGIYVPNDICPLLWTQANLKLALRMASLTYPNLYGFYPPSEPAVT